MAYGSIATVLKQELSLTACDTLEPHITMLIKQLKKDENSIVRERVAEAILSDGKRNFWSEIKWICSHKSSNSRIIVDGQTDVGAIAKLFATISIASYARACRTINTIFSALSST